MHDKVRELIEVARHQSIVSTDQGMYFNLDLFHDKLSELVVQECLSRLNELRLPQVSEGQSDRDTGYNQGVDDSITALSDLLGQDESN